MSTTELLIGIMSGTSLDGADAVLASFQEGRVEVLAHVHQGFQEGLRAVLFKLQSRSDDELDAAQIAAQALVHHYAGVTRLLLEKAAVPRSRIRALAVHGQTIRHRPERGYTLQLNAPALLAELTGLDVIADFRSRDVAAGGHGAPLVPAFHAAIFGDSHEHRAVLNLGGIANLTDLPGHRGSAEANLRGWDTGPGNVFLDQWFVAQHALHSDDFDRAGGFAASGRIDPALLAALLSEPWLRLAPPKSTGRDRFDGDWLRQHLQQTRSDPAAADVQATLAEFTATTVADALAEQIPDAMRLIVCGGGVANTDLMARLGRLTRERLGHTLVVESSAAHGVLPEHVEATAFAWLGRRFLNREAGNRAAVTGARGERILGALYPA